MADVEKFAASYAPQTVDEPPIIVATVSQGPASKLEGTLISEGSDYTTLEPAQIVAALDETYPGIRERLCQGDHLNPAVMVSVDGRVARLGLLEPVGEDSEVLFLPAVAGG